MTIVDKITKPQDCFLGMCLPVTKEDFFKSLETDSNKTYSKIRQRQLKYNRESLWEIDHFPLVRLFLEKKKELEKLGVKVCLNFSLADFKQIQNYDVATIFAHHDDKLNMVELFDGMQNVDIIIKSMPNDYDRILDMTMCRSISLQTAVTRHFKNCIIAANKMETNPEFRLLCYSKTISLLQSENINYIDAIARVRILLINSMKKK